MHMSIESDAEVDLKMYICFGSEENALKGPPWEFIEAKLTQNQNAGPDINLFDLGDFRVGYMINSNNKDKLQSFKGVMNAVIDNEEYHKEFLQEIKILK